MKYKSKKIIVICIFLVLSFLLAISSANAEIVQDDSSHILDSLDDSNIDVYADGENNADDTSEDNTNDNPQEQDDSTEELSAYDKFVNDLDTASDGDIINLTDDIVINDCFYISNDITIEGNNHTIDANKTTSIIYSTSAVTLNNIIFKNGDNYKGGAIYASGKMTINNCQFIDNVASGDGGAIFSNDELIIDNCLFNNNKAYEGGAITNTYSTTITNSIFTNNKALKDAGAIKLWGSDVYIKNTTFYTNTVIKNSNDASRGGAIIIEGNLEIIDSTFKNNGLKSSSITHSNAANYNFNGGAIYLYGGTSKFTGCHFISNYADNHGGAIFAYQYVDQTIIDKCEFKENKANYEDGGAISFSGKKLTLTSSQFKSNFAYEDGGAMDSYSSITSGSSKYSVTINIDKCQFDSNKGYKGAGAIWLGVLTKYTIKNSNFTNNKAAFSGVLYMEGTSANIDKCYFKNNKATKMEVVLKTKGGQVIQHTGGVIENEKGTTKITNSQFQYNTADYGGAIYNAAKSLTLSKCEISNSKGDAGGAIYNKGTISVSSSKFNNNKATHGGVLFNGASSVTFSSCTMYGNSVSGSGGAIIVNAGKVTVKSSTFTKNQATFGGVISNKANLAVAGSTFENNKATCGGAIFDDKGTCAITSSVFKSNTASKVGGALHYKSGKLTLKGNAFVSNKAPSSKAVYCKKAVSLNNNWWGNIKKAPNKLKLTNVNVNTWLKLKVSASPAKIAKGKKTTIVIDLRFNNKNKKVGSIAKVPISLTSKNGALSVKSVKLSSGVAKVKFQKTGNTGKVTANALGTKITVTIK